MENLTNISVENQAAATTKKARSSAKPLGKAKNPRTKKAKAAKTEQAAPVAEAPATEPQAQTAPADSRTPAVAFVARRAIESAGLSPANRTIPPVRSRFQRRSL